MKAHKPIRVLVVDDSAFSRKTITKILDSSPLIEVVGMARDGEDALKKAVALAPDLITLDLEMPRMDGFTFLRLVISHRPTPVIVISSRSGDQDVFKALELGAVDFVSKPASKPGPELERIAHALLTKVHAVRHLRIDKVVDRSVPVPKPVSAPTEATAETGSECQRSVVTIGSSTGGPSALMQLFGSFSEPLPCPILVAQHMPEGFTEGFAERINRLTVFDAEEASGGEELRSGQILIAPGGSHLELESHRGRVVTKIIPQAGQERFAPSVDRLFLSAAKQYGPGVLGVVLTGMGDDGRLGSLGVKEAGGNVIAESEETAVIFGMPQRAIRAGAVDLILPLGDIGTAILRGGRQ
jgi:two-component system chemotaxis response regulator CheB